MRLEDYFSPLDFSSLLIFLGVFISWDIIGVSFNKRVTKLPDEFRFSFWTFGLGMWTFLIFIVHFFFPFRPTIVILPLIIITPVCLKDYFNNFRLFRNQSVLSLLCTILPLLLVIKPIFVKLSLPPYLWDEMAYHWYSPSKLFYENKWDFGTGLYGNLPRLLETASVGIFSLTKTYSTARLLQFLIFFTTAYTLYKVLKKNISFISGLSAFLLFFFYSYNIILQSASGYVDISSASFITLALLTFFYSETIIGLTAFLSLAIGTKYSAISPFISIFSIGIIKNYREIFKKNLTAIILLILLTFGGYWYIKNLILFKNPVYPFFIDCQSKPCTKKSDIFGDWTTPITLSNLGIILADLTESNRTFYILLAISVVLLFVNKDKTSKRFLLIIAAISITDWAISSKTTAFFIRYFIHWQFIIVLFIASSMVISKKNSFLFGLSTVFVFLALLLVFSQTKTTIEKLYLEYKNNPYELAYAKKMVNINQWVSVFFPRLHPVIEWCNNAPIGTSLTVSDPELIWGNYDGLFKIFMVNCTDTIKETSHYNLQTPLYIASLSECTMDLKDKNDDKYHSQKENNNLICASGKIIPYLYKYTGQK